MGSGRRERPSRPVRPGAVRSRGAVRAQRVFIGLGLLIAAGTVARHLLSADDDALFGQIDTILLAGGVAILLLGALPWSSPAGRMYARLFLMGAVTYGVLVIADVIMATAFPPSSRVRNHAIAVQGLFQADETCGWVPTPQWEGEYDDGVVRADVRINSRGHRDDEPTDTPRDRRILLCGDSFAFGDLLRGDETIDKQMERLAQDRLDAYNLGVSGYGLPQIVEFVKRESWCEASTLLYLFFVNDLRDDARDADRYTVRDGFLVPRLHADGRPYTEEEYRERIRAARSEPARRIDLARTARDAVRLNELQRRVSTFLHREDQLVSGPPEWYRDENVPLAVEHTRALSDVAASRGMRFVVVIVPTKGETAVGRYCRYDQAYVDALAAEGFEVIELLGEVSSDHYFPHDFHFNAAGAEVAAKTILRHLLPSRR